MEIEGNDGSRAKSMESNESNYFKNDISAITAKLFFPLVMTASSLEPRYQIAIPSKIAGRFPNKVLPMALICRDKRWDTVFRGKYAQKRFDVCGWKKFAKDTNLKIGDACVFELIDEGKLEFKVQILDGQLPPEYYKGQAKTGENSDSGPIIEIE